MLSNTEETDVSKEEKKFLHNALLGYIVKNNNTSIIGEIILALIIFYILQSSIQESSLTIWIAYMLVISVLRFLAGKITEKQLKQSKKQQSGTYLLMSLLAMSVGWGYAGGVFLQPDNIIINSYVLLALTGLAAGSIASTSYLINYYISFIFISASPLILGYLIQGDNHSMIYAATITFFGLYMVKVADLYRKQIINNLLLNRNNEVLITELKQQNNEITSANHLKNRFLSNMSHELRTPINSTLGFIHLLKQTENDAIKKNYLSIIYNASKELLEKIDSILSFANLEEKEMVILNKSESIIQIINKTIKLHQSLLTQKQIKVNLDTGSSLPEKIEIDALKVQQITEALLSNAIKFSKKNQLINISVNYQTSNQTLSITIQDFGKGIHPDKLDYILLPFTQEDLSDKRDHDGQGLGLTIAYQLINLLGGKLSIESELNQGSTFCFTIPAEESKINLKKDKLTGSILIVEDNPTSQLLISKLVQSIGLDYTIANDGIEAIEQFKKQPFDLILMDENMPRMTGIEATTEIRKLMEGKDIKIIAITANALEGDKERFLKAGMNDYLKKPLDIAKFYTLLRKILK